jgi:acetyl-CoA carboxylase/biotin carboxylase 1
MKRLTASVQAIMSGYEPDIDIHSLVISFMESINNLALLNYEFREALSSIASRIPSSLANYLYENSKISKEYLVSMDISAIEKQIAETLSNLTSEEQIALNDLLVPLKAVIARYKSGVPANARNMVLNLLTDYSGLETKFQSSTAPRGLLRAKDLHKSELEVVMSLARAVSKPENRTQLILHILDYIQKNNSPADQEEFLDVLNSLTRLTNKSASKVAVKAREILISYSLPSIQRRREAILTVFSKVSKNSPDGKRIYFDFSQLSRLVTSRHPILDILPDLFFHQEFHLRAIALYTYVMRTNQAYTVTSFEHHFLENSVMFSWEFDLLDQSFYRTQGAAETMFDDGVKGRKVRKGIMLMSEKLDDILDHVKGVLPEIELPPEHRDPELFYCYATIAVKPCEEFETDEKAAEVLLNFVVKYTNFLSKRMIQRITFMIQRQNASSRYFTFKASDGFKEDPVIRHIEPFMAHRLELGRLGNFTLNSCDVEARGLRVYHAISKSNSSDSRFFVRGIIHPTNSSSFQDFLTSEGNRITTDMLDTLELLTASHPNIDCNHILLHFIPIFNLEREKVLIFFEQLIRKNLERFFKLRVTEMEICYMGSQPVTKTILPYRIIIEIKSQFVIDISWYIQEKDIDGTFRLKSTEGSICPLHNELVYRLHAPKQAIQPKRYKAHLLGTSYVYDLPALFQEALKLEWMRAKLSSPEFPIDCVELCLNSDGELEETKRLPGSNDCGMVVFKMKMLTPEYPKGRSVIIIVNDITFQMGSFGPTEDLVFLRASKLARKLGIPRIYVSANSGARIGLADEVMSIFKISWKNENEKQKGFDYLYLDEEDYNNLNKDKNRPSVTATPVSVKNTIRYKLTSVIGRQHGLGVENLHGSGEIAGETSVAYREIFTITLVTCRSVGIGAYLVRLGQRVVQVEYAPIILTGAGALNKVLGRQVYQSNLQLGGTRIMHSNGVSHLKVENDLKGVSEIIRWLSYVPETNRSPLPITTSFDLVSRPIGVPIPNGPYDPRALMEGRIDEGEWKGGFFDEGSFTETLTGWAKGVIVGRGRLGGIPMGCICVETRTTETVMFADPAVETSQEESIKEAGQVWYPNSAFKTAQAIRDFNNGEKLPLIIFANWRGFSGGQSDMYKEVLKFGAQIVDALTEFSQPIFIYVIGELRGGAWVVVDPSINPNMMEMYCSENARGGVLEPQGIVEIKFRTPKVISTMERLDSPYISLRKSLEVPGLNVTESTSLSTKLKEREKNLIPIFEQAAVEVADLHDRPQRMLKKGVVKAVVEWEKSREFFYNRLVRRIREDELANEIKSCDQSLSFSECKKRIVDWFGQDFPFVSFENDKVFLDWINLKSKEIKVHLTELKRKQFQKQIIESNRSSPAAFFDAFKSIATHFDEEERQNYLSLLSSIGQQ